MPRAVLTFHSIDDSGSVLSFPTRAFGELLEGIAASGTPVMRYEELRSAPNGVAITFDDGMSTVVDNALPVLRSLHLPSHLFLTTGAVGRDNRWASQPPGIEPMAIMDWGGVEACVSAGMSIENHTASHPDLRGLSAAAITEECATADEVIERCVGRGPRLFAYPYGYVSTTAREVAAARYEGSFTADMGYLHATADPHRIPRIDAYYLRSALMNGRLMSRSGQAYLGFRSILRAIRRNA